MKFRCHFVRRQADRTGVNGKLDNRKDENWRFWGEGGINESLVVGGVGLRITILPPTHIAQFKTAQNAGKAGGRGYTLAPLHFRCKGGKPLFYFDFFLLPHQVR